MEEFIRRMKIDSLVILKPQRNQILLTDIKDKFISGELIAKYINIIHRDFNNTTTDFEFKENKTDSLKIWNHIQKILNIMDIKIEDNLIKNAFKNDGKLFDKLLGKIFDGVNTYIQMQDDMGIAELEAMNIR